MLYLSGKLTRRREIILCPCMLFRLQSKSVSQPSSYGDLSMRYSSTVRLSLARNDLLHRPALFSISVKSENGETVLYGARLSRRRSPSFCLLYSSLRV